MKGWISIHRSIVDNFLWEDKPFSKGQAWIDMLLLANHKDNITLLGNEAITIEKGSFITSEVKLMGRWGWSKSKVRSYLQLLQNNSMVVKKTDHKKTTITIVNYSVYQEIETTKEPQKDHKKTAKEPQKDISNNEETEMNPPVISLQLNDKSYYDVYAAEIDKWSLLYPNADVIQELKKMVGWLDANPARRKTRVGIKRFITNWLSKVQDKGNTYFQNSQSVPSSTKGSTFAEMLSEMGGV